MLLFIAVRFNYHEIIKFTKFLLNNMFEYREHQILKYFTFKLPHRQACLKKLVEKNSIPAYA